MEPPEDEGYQRQLPILESPLDAIVELGARPTRETERGEIEADGERRVDTERREETRIVDRVRVQEEVAAK